MRFRCSVNTPPGAASVVCPVCQTLSGLVFRDVRGEQGFIGAQARQRRDCHPTGGTEFELSTPDDYTILGVVISEDTFPSGHVFA